MAYIQPSTTIYLFEDIPFDPDYENTGYFATKADQETYFLTTHGAFDVLSNHSYQRAGLGVIKIERRYEECYQVNYMMFKNTANAYEQKWFYAFVTSVEYISDTVSALHYQIDVMQTWLTDYVLEECFIDRQHGETDNIGDNIAPETVDVGEQVYNDYQIMPINASHDIHTVYAVVCICDVNSGSVQGTEVQNVYSGAVMYAFDVSNPVELNDLNQFLTRYIQRPDAVVGMYMCPECLLVRAGGSGGDYSQYFVLNAGNAPLYHIQLPTLTAQGNTLNGYAPRNMKMFTYPYNYLSVDNAMGSGLSLRYEYFGTGVGGQSKLTPRFTLDGSAVQPVQLRIRPENYKGSGGHYITVGQNSVFVGDPNNAEFSTVDNYPMCSWNFDSYKAWCAQGSAVAGAKIAGNVIGLGVPRVTARGEAQLNMNQVANTWGSITNALIERYQASIAADMFKGTLEMGNVNVAEDMSGFWYGRVSCNAQVARRIDDYFTMFGYAQGVVGTPNRHARQRFTYVKTIGCEVNGDVPADDRVKIKSIFNQGVRFWADVTHVGNYLLANPVLT